MKLTFKFILCYLLINAVIKRFDVQPPVSLIVLFFILSVDGQEVIILIPQSSLAVQMSFMVIVCAQVINYILYVYICCWFARSL